MGTQDLTHVPIEWEKHNANGLVPLLLATFLDLDDAELRLVKN